MQLKDSNGNNWNVTAVGIDGRGRALFEFRDDRGLPRSARLSLVTLTNAKRARRWLRFHAGIDVVFDRAQHVADLGKLARELNA